MAQTVCVIVTEAEKARLRDQRGSRSPLKHVQRARIFLLSADKGGLGNQQYEGRAQWGAEPERAGRLVDRSLRGRNYRVGNRSAGGWKS